ncbi:hypothetical protein [Mycobacteroides abscessus]|uniref:hypothetical protein n=1 Tax=Mycobacteroides abscessus TaxID=36809 RepID=UPI00266D8B84|nr:hypothetical protein [Mycobacteroides abscessus]MDO3331370.1 hypothetical protein [Mycobacteroides abscessus subsp. abscessus]
MTQPDNNLPILDQPVTVSNPAGSISVTTANNFSTQIALTPAALNGVSEAELAANILDVARFSRDRDRANRADRLVQERVAAGANEQECRTRIHRVNHLPTQQQVDEAYSSHYQAERDE